MADKKIPVVAIRDGYIHDEIKLIGARFEVDTVQELGSWMERLDGGVNPAENRHLIPAKVVADKAFKPLDESKLLDASAIQSKAEKEVKASQADAPVGVPAKKAPNNKDLF